MQQRNLIHYELLYHLCKIFSLIQPLLGYSHPSEYLCFFHLQITFADHSPAKELYPLYFLY